MVKNNAIGLDIGGTNLRAALVSENGTILKRDQYPSGKDVLNTVYHAIDKYREDNTAGIGIAVAGLVNRTQGKVTVSPNLPEVEGIEFIQLLTERYSLPVFIDNDANFSTFGEKHAGAGKGLDSFILMTLGTGIGGGIIQNGRLLDLPAEFGHMVVESDGHQCECGNRGCVEEYAAAKAMINLSTSALEKGEESTLKVCCDGNIYRITPELIFEHAIEGDRLSRDILRTSGRYLGIALSNLTNIFHPQAFILTGGLTNAWDIYVVEAIREAERRALKGLFHKDMVLRSGIREDAGLIGAALYALMATNQ